jgi:hypothetical protein
MAGLRSRKDAAISKSPSGDEEAGSGFSNDRRGRSSKGSSSSASSPGTMVAGLLGVLGFVLFVVFLKVTAPPAQERYAGMEMLKSKQHSKSMFKDGAGRQVQKVGKKGGVLHKPITSVKKEDLKGLLDEMPDNIDTITYEEAIEGRERLVEILTDAGVEELDVPTILNLPKWSSVTKLYGDGPVVIGLETCERFRETIPLDDASIGTAGMNVKGIYFTRFPFGTNQLDYLILIAFVMIYCRNVQYGDQPICDVYRSKLPHAA